WAGMARIAPWLVNFLGRAPGTSQLMKWLGGISQKRNMPAFANETFTAWFRRRPLRNPDRPPVILWPDTFSNNFHPEIAKAAVEVLEHAGYQVKIPQQALCCGRPLYDFGLLDQAKATLEQTLAALRDDIEAGTPIIGIEPSCVSVFRDEMTNLLGKNLEAHKLKSQTYLFSEFLINQADYRPPQLKRKAIVHAHCHHKSVLKFDSESELLKRIGLDFHVLDSGCCGMAGSFGFEAEKYDVSVKIGERVLLPAVRKADPETLIIADGFSCFEQIDDLVGRKALHIAEVLQMAIRQEQGEEETPRKIPTAALAGVGAVLAGAALYFAFNDKTSSPSSDRIA